jgi:hypothetical protein
MASLCHRWWPLQRAFPYSFECRRHLTSAAAHSCLFSAGYAAKDSLYIYVKLRHCIVARFYIGGRECGGGGRCEYLNIIYGQTKNGYRHQDTERRTHGRVNGLKKVTFIPCNILSESSSAKSGEMDTITLV